MPKILVQYKGGGYDGCFWEWNFCLVDDPETPTKFQNIQSSGSNGIKSLEAYKSYGFPGNKNSMYFYDIDKKEDWLEFQNEANPAHVLGVYTWIETHLEDIPDHIVLLCDVCGNPLNIESAGEDTNYYYGIFFGGGRGDGGIGIQYDQKMCECCSENQAYENCYRGLIKDELEDQDLDFNDLDQSDFDRIVWYAMAQSESYWETDMYEGHDLDYGDLIEYIVEHKDTIRHDALCHDDQMSLLENTGELKHG